MQIVAMETPTQLERLADAAVDVGIVRPLARYPDGIAARVVHSEKLMIAVSAESPLARAKTLKATQLRGVPFIAPQFNEATGFAEHLVKLGRIGGFDAEPEYRVNDFMTAVSMASAGYGVALVPKSLEAFSPPGVKFKSLVDFDDEAALALAYESLRHLPSVPRAFIDLSIVIDRQ